MPLFATSYVLPNGDRAATQCYARDVQHLRDTIHARCMGESAERADLAVPAPLMPSDHLRLGNLPEAVHAAIWVCMIATRANTVSAWDILCDMGVVHELTHMLIGAGTFRQAYGYDSRLIADLEQLERATPGVHPSWGGERPAEAASEDLVLAEARRRHAEAMREQQRRLQVFLPFKAAIRFTTRA